MTTATRRTTEPPVTAATSAAASGSRQPEPGRRRFRLQLTGVRARILLAYVALLSAATLASILVARALLVAQLDARIDGELVQEVDELRQLAGGTDPETSRPFGGDVQRIFDVFLERNVPSRQEALLTFVDGEPYKRSRTVVEYRLHEDPALVERWGSLRATDRGSYETPVGRIEYLAVPLEVRGSGERPGVFVAVLFRDLAKKQLDTPLAAVGGVGLVVLVVGSLLAWVVADSVLRPVRRATSTARQISDTDLTQRIPVSGNDEGAELARTFNLMLDRLEEAFTTQRTFLDDTGHELRTPITIMRGHLELMGDDPQEREETVALVLDELSRMARIVNDLLLLAKAEQPNFLQLTPVDVADLTLEVSEKARALAPREWVVEHVATGTIRADPQRITQALVQLAQNAVQHTQEGNEIAIGSFVEHGQARFWVRDDGPGISAEEQDRVFERFARARGNRHPDGAGLGLSIVRAIAEAHHGSVELSSRPGAGATFTLVVPVEPP